MIDGASNDAHFECHVYYEKNRVVRCIKVHTIRSSQPTNHDHFTKSISYNMYIYALPLLGMNNQSNLIFTQLLK